MVNIRTITMATATITTIGPTIITIEATIGAAAIIGIDLLTNLVLIC